MDTDSSRTAMLIRYSDSFFLVGLLSEYRNSIGTKDDKLFQQSTNLNERELG